MTSKSSSKKSFLFILILSLLVKRFLFYYVYQKDSRDITECSGRHKVFFRIKCFRIKCCPRNQIHSPGKIFSDFSRLFGQWPHQPGASGVSTLSRIGVYDLRSRSGLPYKITKRGKSFHKKIRRNLVNSWFLPTYK